MTKETLFEFMEKTPAACTRAVFPGARVPLLRPALSWSPAGRCSSCVSGSDSTRRNPWLLQWGLCSATCPSAHTPLPLGFVNRSGKCTFSCSGGRAGFLLKGLNRCLRSSSRGRVLAGLHALRACLTGSPSPIPVSTSLPSLASSDNSPLSFCRRRFLRGTGPFRQVVVRIRATAPLCLASQHLGLEGGTASDRIF